MAAKWPQGNSRSPEMTWPVESKWFQTFFWGQGTVGILKPRYIIYIIRYHLSSWWWQLNPFEKYQSKWESSPGRDENKKPLKFLKPPSSLCVIFSPGPILCVCATLKLPRGVSPEWCQRSRHFQQINILSDRHLQRSIPFVDSLGGWRNHTSKLSLHDAYCKASTGIVASVTH